MPKYESEVMSKLKEKNNILKKEARKLKKISYECYHTIQSNLPDEIKRKNPKIKVPAMYGYKLALINTKLIALQSIKNKIRKNAQKKIDVPFGQWLGPLSSQKRTDFEDSNLIIRKSSDDSLSYKGSYSVSTRCESQIIN